MNGSFKGIVPHGLLITKFKRYRLTNEVFEFMSSYLTGKYQSIGLSNEKCSQETFAKGIPQGSGLWPIIFNIFTVMLFNLYKNVIVLIVQMIILFQR